MTDVDRRGQLLRSLNIFLPLCLEFFGLSPVLRDMSDNSRYEVIPEEAGHTVCLVIVDNFNLSLPR